MRIQSDAGFAVRENEGAMVAAVVRMRHREDRLDDEQTKKIRNATFQIISCPACGQTVRSSPREAMESSAKKALRDRERKAERSLS
jgi:4-hydroxy-3-methylbut-2-en-1-yl diphosphate synthase IspG/GcpE